MATEQDLDILSRKLNQLKLAYEQYFLGSRPREPMLLRDEVQKTVILYSNTPIQNTALRFRFGSINSRYQALKRQWSETLRKIESGTYERHRFRAKLHQRYEDPPDAIDPMQNDQDDIYTAYLEARRRCGQPTDRITPEKLDAILAKEKEALRDRFGDGDVSFRVVVEDGKAKLKARRG